MSCTALPSSLVPTPPSGTCAQSVEKPPLYLTPPRGHTNRSIALRRNASPSASSTSTGLANIDGVTVTIGRHPPPRTSEAVRTSTASATRPDLAVLGRATRVAVILCTPTQLHASQASRPVRAGKHLQVGDPGRRRWADAQAVSAGASRNPAGPSWSGNTRRVATRAISGSHRRIGRASCPSSNGTCRTYFFRRTTMTRRGPAIWTDPALSPRRAPVSLVSSTRAGEQTHIPRGAPWPASPRSSASRMACLIQLRHPSGVSARCLSSSTTTAARHPSFRYICSTAPTSPGTTIW